MDTTLVCPLHPWHCQPLILFLSIVLFCLRIVFFFCLLNPSGQSRALTVQADNNNRARLGTSRSRHDAGPRGKKKRLNYFAARRRETNRCSHTCYRSPPSFSSSFVRFLFLEAVSTVARADWSFGIERPETRGRKGGVSSPARSIVAYETRRWSPSTSRRRDTRFSEWAEELLHPPPPPQRSRELSYVRTYSGAMRACAPSSCCASCRTRGIICGQGTTTIGTFTPHAMPGVPYTMGSSWPPTFRPPLARALRWLTSNTILLKTGVFLRSEQRLLSSAITCDVKLGASPRPLPR